MGRCQRSLVERHIQKVNICVSLLYCLSVCMSVCMYVSLIYTKGNIQTHVSILCIAFVSLSVGLSVGRCVCFPAVLLRYIQKVKHTNLCRLSVFLSVCLSVYRSLCLFSCRFTKG